MARGRLKRYDTVPTGVAAGVALPLLVFWVIYLVRYSGMSVNEYFSELWEFRILLKLLSLCAFSNLLIFLLFIRKKMDHAAKGVLTATFLYAFLVLFSAII